MERRPCWNSIEPCSGTCEGQMESIEIVFQLDVNKRGRIKGHGSANSSSGALSSFSISPLPRCHLLLCPKCPTTSSCNGQSIDNSFKVKSLIKKPGRERVRENERHDRRACATSHLEVISLVSHPPSPFRAALLVISRLTSRRNLGESDFAV